VRERIMKIPRRVILISGDPNHGKSFLAEALRNQHNFHLLSTDGMYVEFVRTAVQALFLPALGQVILQHYDTMLSQSPQAVAAWHQHLFEHIVRASDEYGDLAVEGYLLKDCKDRFEVELKTQGRDVFQIRMENKAPILESPRLTVAQVAALGSVRTRPKKR
jgi:hypothetical protein